MKMQITHTARRSSQEKINN